MEELRNYIEDLKSKFVRMTDKNYCYLETGEVFTEAEVSKFITLKVEEYNINVLGKLKHEAFTNGIEIGQKITNKRSKRKKSKCKVRYDIGEFNILYRGEMENFMGLKLTLIEEGVFSRLCKFLHYPTNCVMINDCIPSIEVLMTIMGLKERALRGHLKTLENKGVIKMVQVGHSKAIYVNPKYCATGKDLDIDTLKLFNLLECDDEKVNSCL